MIKGSWTSEDGRIFVQVCVYTRRDSFLRSLRRYGSECNNRGVRGQATTCEVINYKTNRKGVKKSKSYVLLMADWCTPGVLAHELIHIAHDIARIFKRKRFNSFEETVCCIADELMDIFDPWMRKKKLYKSRSDKFHGLITP